MNKQTITVQSAGRINLIGEHIDYNDGFVLPAAIDKKTIFQLTKNGTNSQVNIVAKNVQQSYSFDLMNFQPIENGWENYIMGVISELQKLGAKLSGFDAQFEGDVPIGSGMSSSAALECSLAYGLNELFDLGFDKWQLIKVAQLAEHHFVGIKCGIMDQFASIMGKQNQVMLLDCRSLEFKYFPLNLGDYELLLLNTNVSHNLASSAYNDRRQECQDGLTILKKYYPSVTSFREVTSDMLLHIQTHLSPIVFKRCRHVILETQRVLEATKALQNADFKHLGELIYSSHRSLSEDYEVSCSELDFLVQQTLDKDYILGSRMMGGGFGGCTLNLIHKSQTNHFINTATKAYKNAFNLALTPYQVTIENGASVLETR